MWVRFNPTHTHTHLAAVCPLQAGGGSGQQGQSGLGTILWIYFSLWKCPSVLIFQQIPFCCRRSNFSPFCFLESASRRECFAGILLRIDAHFTLTKPSEFTHKVSPNNLSIWQGNPAGGWGLGVGGGQIIQVGWVRIPFPVLHFQDGERPLAAGGSENPGRQVPFPRCSPQDLGWLSIVLWSLGTFVRAQ